MDIYKFFNSPDVAEHCKKMNKVWNTFEMAVIIGMSDCKINEKLAAWRELINDYPDMPTPESFHQKSHESTHQELIRQIEYIEKELELLFRQEDRAIYNYKVYGTHDSVHNEIKACSSFDKIMNCIRENLERDEVISINIYRNYIDGEYYESEASVDYDGNVNWVSTYCGDACEISFYEHLGYTDYEYDLFTSDYYYIIDIPIPFKQGDVLIDDNSKDSRIFVLDRVNDRPTDGSDLMGNGYYATDGGGIVLSHAFCYSNWRYYRGKLEGKYRILHYVSLFMKGEIQLDHLLSMQCKIVTEYQVEDNFGFCTCSGCSVPDKLLAENFDYS